jgi:hypothetical protein
MKQVRYLVGAVGLAPLALAATGTPLHVGADHAKKVSLHPITQATDCLGRTEAYRAVRSSYERFWYTPNSSVTCIGTVEYYDSSGSIGLDMRVRIWGPNLQYQNYVHGTIEGNGVYFADVVRNYFGGDFHPVEVCVAAVLSGAKSLVEAGPICITVPG